MQKVNAAIVKEYEEKKEANGLTSQDLVDALTMASGMQFGGSSPTFNFFMFLRLELTGCSLVDFLRIRFCIYSTINPDGPTDMRAQLFAQGFYKQMYGTQARSNIRDGPTPGCKSRFRSWISVRVVNQDHNYFRPPSL